jgi:hypothetical protein
MFVCLVALRAVQLSTWWYVGRAVLATSSADGQ